LTIIVFLAMFSSGMASRLKPVPFNQKRKEKNMARVKIPKNKADAIKLAQAILKKHTADGAASPLAALNIADMTTKTGTADTQNQLSDKLYRDAETATENTNLAVGSDYTTPGTVNYFAWRPSATCRWASTRATSRNAVTGVIK
jgi:hypothetical protein